MVAPFLNIVTLCPQTYYDIVQGDLVIIEINSPGALSIARSPIGLPLPSPDPFYQLQGKRPAIEGADEVESVYLILDLVDQRGGYLQPDTKGIGFIRRGGDTFADLTRD